MWVIWVQAAAAFYLVGGALVINCENIPSKIVFKVIPICIGLPLAFAVAGKLLGWPI